MPRGGRREGSGRKRGSKAAVRTREVANEAIVRGVKLPLEYMLAVLGDETAPQARRDQMAIQAAPYCHPRLSAVGLSGHGRNVSDGGGNGCVVDVITQIFAVPRGARFAADGTVTIEGEATELKPVEPYNGTPALTDQTEQPAPMIAEPLPVIEFEVPENVTRLDTFQRKRDDDGA
jgi:hypothetical protein